jgi:hypothetical protein
MKEESCGNGGVVESVEIQKQDFPSSHRSLEISQKPRDSHIPTAPATSLGFRTKKPPRSADCVGEEKGDTSIEVRKGTFLTRLDSSTGAKLTGRAPAPTMKGCKEAVWNPLVFRSPGLSAVWAFPK